MEAMGTRFFREADVTGTFEEIGGVYNIEPAELSVDTVDDTVLTSPKGIEEKAATIIRNGDYQLELRYDAGGETKAKFTEDLLSRKKRKYRMVDPDEEETYEEFTALTTNVGRGSIAPDGQMRLNVTLSVTGEPTTGSGMDAI